MLSLLGVRCGWQLFAGKEKANSVDQKCPVCGTLSTMDRTTRKISLASGPDFISAQ